MKKKINKSRDRVVFDLFSVACLFYDFLIYFLLFSLSMRFKCVYGTLSEMYSIQMNRETKHLYAHSKNKKARRNMVTHRSVSVRN